MTKAKPAPITDREPVRVYAYGFVGLLVVALVVLGITTQETATWALGIMATLVAPGFIEAARSKVTPTDG